MGLRSLSTDNLLGCINDLFMTEPYIYSRTLVARTLMVCSPRLFRTRSETLTKNPIAADIIAFWIIAGDFHYCIDIGILCVLIRIASMRLF